MSDLEEQGAPRNIGSVDNSRPTRYRRKRQPMTLETRERIRAKLKAHYRQPENLEAARRRMRRPNVVTRISERTTAALAEPATKARQKAGLHAAWADPEKRAAQAELTAQRMIAWRTRKLAESAVVIQQMPKAERAAALTALAEVVGRGGGDAR